MNRLGDAPTDLLFGLIALNNDLVAPAVIPAALRARLLEPSRKLAELLVNQGALTPAQRDLVETLSGEYINRHGGDAGKALAALIETPSARERLDRLGDPELTGSLTPAVSLGSTGPCRARSATAMIPRAPCPRRRTPWPMQDRTSPVTRSWRCWALAGWGSSTRRGTSGSTGSSL